MPSRRIQSCQWSRVRSMNSRHVVERFPSNGVSAPNTMATGRDSTNGDSRSMYASGASVVSRIVSPPV
jgi:hypothetical protein